MAIFFLLLVAVIVGGAIKVNVEKRSRKVALNKEFDRRIASIADFKQSKVYRSPDSLAIIAMDVDLKRIVVARIAPVTGVCDSTVINFKDIRGSDIIIDGDNVSTKSVGGAIVGGALFGVAGAIIGSNTGKTTSKQKISNITLKLLINSLLAPTYEIPFFDKKVSFTKADIVKRDCQMWQDTFSVALVN